MKVAITMRWEAFYQRMTKLSYQVREKYYYLKVLTDATAFQDNFMKNNELFWINNGKVYNAGESKDISCTDNLLGN